MSEFVVTVVNPVSNETKKVIYNSSVSTLTWEDGTAILESKTRPEAKQSKLEIGKDPNVVKIQLGLSCNYECEYCSQRFVPHADSTNPSDVDPFVDNMSTWFKGGSDGLGAGATFEFWGGEPFVYWKTMKPLAEKIRLKYPNAQMSVITNGSLFDEEKVDWLVDNGFDVGISHDGPGQFVRGPDPLDDPKSRAGILYAFKVLAPLNRISFNSMVNSKNISRKNVQIFFEDLIRKEFGDSYLQYLSIGEGSFVDAYDEGGVANSLLDPEDEIKYRSYTFEEIRTGGVTRYSIINTKINNFLDSIKSGTRKESVTQKCGMDRKGNIAVDLQGNVLTCQNVSSSSFNPSGISHHIGHVSNLSDIEIKSGTHWSDREDCSKCPVLHICKGACLFLTGPLWETSCNNSFSDNIVVFCAAIEMITGFIPVYIDGPQREDRKDIFWMVNGKPQKSSKKVIPIAAI